jgi:hypothetical protein
MIIQRNIFRLKFGKAKEALAIWKQILEELQQDGRFMPQYRLMTDITGEYYTLILEISIKSLMEVNPMNRVWAINPSVRDLYHEKFVPLCESGQQNMYKVEAET